MSEFLMIIVVAACGSMGSGGSGCGVDIDHIAFSSMEACQEAANQLFPSAAEGATYAEREAAWKPRHEIKCVRS